MFWDRNRVGLRTIYLQDRVFYHTYICIFMYVTDTVLQHTSVNTNAKYSSIFMGNKEHRRGNNTRAKVTQKLLYAYHTYHS